MNFMTKSILTACILCVTFVAGYLVGSNAQPTTSVLNSSETERNQHTTDSSLTTTTSAFNTKKSNAEQRASAPAPTDKSEGSIVSEEPLLVDNGDIIALFNDFLTYSTSNSDYKEYGKKIDDIRNILISSSADLALLLEYFEQVPIDSQASYMLVSIIMGLPQELSKPAMQRVMENALLKEGPENATNFLELVARTGVKSPSITSSLKDIAIFSEKDEETLRALDMLMPYELSNVENQQVRERLLAAINNSTNPDNPYYFSQLLRFSNTAQREQLALDAFHDESNTEMQSIIMDSIQAGTLDRSAALREILFSIAKQDQNELQHQAIYTLLYRFDLSQNEYNDITQGKNLNIENIIF
ncbi:hypothetical protein [Brumicola nitratireducens]|uniref:Uncharacterized protein n=1 Tax=Glaciecola nitratireducens (strain JCM 12485 / KCTC 12276 / FR1064) TaxID=1085623 RepID=G4QKJ3_GLANF|nr:hypothetical protein [Glaciecola nitratireducens]AEP30059.1 hypothetical protein GNIT_1950 [Glaciecola nitratireducens FR1064]